jgi:hypothetical protein
VKDRENNDRLLICAEENDIYNWKTTDGEFVGFYVEYISTSYTRHIKAQPYKVYVICRIKKIIILSEFGNSSRQPSPKK